ncbi:hypothetical protein BCR33DRAFT_718245 [Rhizoclosmatium globosum]|uniref:Pacifastin domain-containing protein n=1 Tax=Rhizoclosmatium globosum TaxID=329046 RepID=A0A1Y2C680_9FUNG|nr:hypothetical protein BCR33DRAFT_718245 [Rhizoclosmatium globosum]|eukprot:ORY42552.1 hypothetical protein BCR33DRAFT_718245 [Rhizoclosmatium globosum]
MYIMQQVAVLFLLTLVKGDTQRELIQCDDTIEGKSCNWCCRCNPITNRLHCVTPCIGYDNRPLNCTGLDVCKCTTFLFQD